MDDAGHSLPAAEWSLDADPLARLVADVAAAADVLRRYSERIANLAGHRRTELQLLSVVSIGNWTTADVADRLGARFHAVRRVAHELIDAGLLVREANPLDPLSPFLRPTKSGKELLDIAGDRERRRRSTLQFKFDGVDLLKLEELLERVTAIARAELGEST